MPQREALRPRVGSPGGWAEFKAGVRAAAPIALGMVPLGIAFGVLMVQSGFHWWWAPVFSVVIYAGSIEFLAIGMITGGVTAVGAALTAFMVNFRHLFYGLTFPREQISSRLGRAYSTYALTDESYAIVSATPDQKAMSGTRILAIQGTCQLIWVLGGAIGALGGNLLPPDLKGTEFALTALFVVLGMEAFRANPDFSLPLIALGLATAAFLLAPQYMLVVALVTYFCTLILRYLSPRMDLALTWKARSCRMQ
ncbi:branched-chain amino acid ABC transporter permease [Corynebacterium phocae]|uniref:Branched-chain amino acid ABC transporter permease n=1 Tax=Corynebacterium phocae TaxID=161895 RepID=A0A1L7D619_9CORY|nr:AzlC family ABC transporter permease [Corynebacterium phocae]APT93545.1 branched-chain amino acid ABC transporter permease [Corynebacterium phocae]KAA8720631.1 AzlC family ABC transporter permease [Corynebacterium phocae]